MTKQTTY